MALILIDQVFYHFYKQIQSQSESESQSQSRIRMDSGNQGGDGSNVAQMPDPGMTQLPNISNTFH